MSKRPLTVTKANHLVEAAYLLTLAEQRLLLLAIARIDGRASLDAGMCHTVEAREMAAAFEIPHKQAYELLRTATERLYERSVVIHTPDPTQSSKSYTLTRWVSTAKFMPDAGAVDVFFAPGILPFISQLKARFSTYQLAYVAPMTSIYAVRIYELLVQWRGCGHRHVELGWLRERLDLGTKYPNIRDLKARVLQPAIEQINAHSDLWVEYSQRKAGRRVVAFEFTFGLKAPLSAEPPAQSSKLTKAYIEQHARPGESWDDAAARLHRALDVGREQGALVD